MADDPALHNIQLVVSTETDGHTKDAIKVKAAPTDEMSLFSKLPPLPTPNHKVKRWQATGGCIIITSIIGVMVAATHSVAQAAYLDYWYVPVALIWAEAIFGFACLLGLMWGDPGVVKRTPENCMPLPPQVAEKLTAGESLDGLANIRGDGGRVFCIRCYVWRPATPKAIPPLYLFGMQVDCSVKGVHHCSMCQRCVTDFDHHCGVFGRCIASGNMRYFRGVIAVGYVGVLTCGISVVAVAGVRWGWQGALISASVFFALVAAMVKFGLQAMAFLGNGPKKNRGGKQDKRRSCVECVGRFVPSRRFKAGTAESSTVILQSSQVA